MPELPSGTVTFLFTDIEGSTALWERDRAAMRTAVARHLAILQNAVAAHRGVLYKTLGDGTQSAFPSAEDGVWAAVDAQRALLGEAWADAPGSLRVRMALHAGEAEPHDGDYLAALLNRLARLLGIAHGGQILLTEAAAGLVQDGLPPGASLRDLGEVRLRDLGRAERAYSLAHPDLPDDLPVRTAAERLRGFPAALTRFLGRNAQVEAVANLLQASDVRLVTLTGPGGIGKTRLAMRVCERVAAEFADGVSFVDLAPLRDPSLVLPAIATALGLREGSARTLEDVVHGYLRERQLLLLLDNFEHLLPSASVVARLLAAGPAVEALVTSREPLRIRGEHEYPVPPLTVPSAAERSELAALEANETVSLFTHSAQAVRPDFALTAETAKTVAEICMRLDGLPLAIELAAARTKVLPPSALLARLDRRLPLLTGGTRDAPERQRTLRDAIAWSYDLLSPEEQKLFRRLGVFVGGWTLDAAEAVVNVDGNLDVLEGLASLVDKSLVRLDGRGPEPRYTMLETIREYAHEWLANSGDAREVAAAHAGFMVGIGERCGEAMLTPEQTAWHERIEAELGNLRAALAWLEQAGEAEPMQALAAACWWALVDRASAREAREWLDRALVLSDGGSPRTRATALVSAGFTALIQGDLQALGTFAEAGLALSRTQGFPLHAGLSLFMLAQAAAERGEYARAASIGDEAISLLRQAGDRRWLAMALNDIGLLTAFSGIPERADQMHEEGLALSRAIGSTWHLAIALSDLGLEAEARGDQQAALDHYRESLAMLRDIGAKWYFAHPLAGIASIASAAGRADLAARLMGAAAILHEMQGTKAFNTAREGNARTVARARAALGDEGFDREFGLGRRLSMVEALRQALAGADDLRQSGCGHEPPA